MKVAPLWALTCWAEIFKTVDLLPFDEVVHIRQKTVDIPKDQRICGIVSVVFSVRNRTPGTVHARGRISYLYNATSSDRYSGVSGLFRADDR